MEVKKTLKVKDKRIITTFVREAINEMFDLFFLNFKNMNPSRSNLGRREKTKSNFYFHTSLWCLKRFYEGLKGLHKTFCGTTKKCENKNLTYFFFQYNFQKCTGREGLSLKGPFFIFYYFFSEIMHNRKLKVIKNMGTKR